MSSKNKSTIKRSAYRATTRHAKPSKEKHVRILIMQTFSRDGAVDDIIKALVKRMEKQNWAVVIKSLMIFHRCFRDGDPAFIEGMKPRSNLVFALRTFSSLAPPNHLFTVFVKKYAKYLEEKVSVLRLLGYQFEKSQDEVKKAKGQNLFKVIPKLQSQLNALLNCKLKAQHAGAHTLINHALILLCQDSLVLYSLLQDSVSRMLDMYWKMNRKDASRTVGIYKLFTKETDALIGLYDVAKQFIRQLPTITKAETSIIDQMEKYLDSLGGPQDSDDEDGTGKKKKGKKGASKRRDDDEDDDDSYGETLNTRAGQEAYDDKDYGSSNEGDDDDDDEESSGEADDAPDYFKDFFAGVPAMANNPFSTGQVIQQPVLANPYQAPQPSPFASQSNAFGTQPSPFASQPATFGSSQQLTTFGAQPSPFGAQPSPFGAQPSASPFGPTASPNVFAQQSSVYSSTGGQSAFGARPAASPFSATASTGGSPFGGGAAAASPNPFAPAAPVASPNPFASAAAPAANPFALVVSPQQPSPFGAPQPAANPFGPPQPTYGAASAYGQPQQQPPNPFL